MALKDKYERYILNIKRHSESNDILFLFIIFCLFIDDLPVISL